MSYPLLFLDGYLVIARNCLWFFYVNIYFWKLINFLKKNNKSFTATLQLYDLAQICYQSELNGNK